MAYTFSFTVGRKMTRGCGRLALVASQHLSIVLLYISSLALTPDGFLLCPVSVPVPVCSSDFSYLDPRMEQWFGLGADSGRAGTYLDCRGFAGSHDHFTIIGGECWLRTKLCLFFVIHPVLMMCSCGGRLLRCPPLLQSYEAEDTTRSVQNA
jgi:hypothetical protein